MSQAVDGFILDKSLNLSATTVAKYAYVLGRFASFVDDQPLADVTSTDVRRWLLSLVDDDLSRRTVHDYWAVLSSFWTWAEQELDAHHAIRGHVPAPKYKKRVIEPFTQDEVRRLLKGAIHNAPWTTATGRTVRSKRATGDRDLATMLVLLDTGLRVSELCSLCIEDYEADRGRLRVNAGKGDKERVVIVGNRARKALWRYLTKRPNAKPDDPLFVASSNRPMSRASTYRMIRRAGERESVRNAHPHRFRHTFAIQFLRNGGSAILLQELLGHESLNMVLIYVQLAARDIDDAGRHSPADNWRL